MKFKYLILIIVITGLASCERIVDVKVNEVDPYLVVDAWLSRTPEDQVIRLTTTQPYFDNSFTPAVSGAEVRLTDNSGNEFIFQDQGDGNYAYASTDTFGVVGETYNLEILWEGNTYSSSTILPRKVLIDSLVYNTVEEDEPEEDYYAEFFGRDPDGVGDAYWLKAYKNGKYLNKPTHSTMSLSQMILEKVYHSFSRLEYYQTLLNKTSIENTCHCIDLKSVLT